MFKVAKASSGGLPPLIRCAGVTFAVEMTFSLMLPLAVPCVPALILVCWAIQRGVRGRPVATAPIWGVDKLHFFANSSVAVAYLLWPALVVQVLRILDCSVDIAGTKYVASDVSVKCYHGVHARLHAAAIAELVLVVPALPALLIYRLRCHRLGPGSMNRKHLYFLYGGFRHGYEYWEGVVCLPLLVRVFCTHHLTHPFALQVLLRKFLVLAVSVFLADNAFGLQVAAAMWVMCAATVLQLLCKPYQNETEQQLEKLSLGSITIACMIGQVIHLGRGEEGLGRSGLILCRTMVGLVIAGTSSCFVAFFVHEVRHAIRRKQDSRKEKGQKPSCTIHGCDFSAANPMHLPQQGAKDQNAATSTVVQASPRHHDSVESTNDLKERAKKIYESQEDVSLPSTSPVPELEL